jgi:hypothetical protein
VAIISDTQREPLTDRSLHGSASCTVGHAGSETGALKAIEEEMEEKTDKFDSNQSTCRKKKKEVIGH